MKDGNCAEHKLYGDSSFLENPTWPSEKDNNQPRALRGLARIIDEDLCHRCGSCVGICPTDVLAVDSKEYPVIKNLSACTDCDLCVKVCPGEEFDYKGHYRKLFNKEADIKDTHGHFLEAAIGYAKHNGLRASSTSGGIITAILLHLLETDQIDGAIVTTSDEDQLWKGKPIIARTKEEILSATKSKYAISPTNVMLSEIRKVKGRYAVVGLPCQIHGIIKAAELDPRIKERVFITIGLLCHAAIEHEAFEIIWDSLGDKTVGAKRFVSRVGKHPGSPHLELANGDYHPVYFGDKKGFKPSSMEMINILYRLYTPARCMTCFDGTAEFADIAVGDPWMPPPQDDIDFNDGWSFSLMRTERGLQIYKELIEKDKIENRVVTFNEAKVCNTAMATEKKWRAFRVIDTQVRQGKAVPCYGEYDFELPARKGKHFIKTEINIFTHIFCFVPKWRASVLRFMLSEKGYTLLWINNKRRRVKLWLRDTIARTKRKALGRN